MKERQIIVGAESVRAILAGTKRRAGPCPRPRGYGGERVLVAALYVARGGTYYGLPDVDPWDQERDARLYAGPHPVVAHPPCERWGDQWHGCRRTGDPKRGRLGEDGGCFAAALAAVRRWGGVLEHPATSRAWAAHGLPWPLSEGWAADLSGGWSCQVEQGHYGHVAAKPTWLYAVDVELPALKWGRSGAGSLTGSLWDRGGDRSRTPPAFRDLLLSIARTSGSSSGCKSMGGSNA